MQEQLFIGKESIYAADTNLQNLSFLYQGESFFSLLLASNKDYINERVKHREGWRPYAPIMLEEYIHDWYDIPKTSSPYMLFNAWLLPEKKGKVPAVTHNDGSARIQTVTEELNKPIFQLLTE